LSERVIARVAASERLPTTKLPELPLHHRIQREVQSEVSSAPKPFSIESRATASAIPGNVLSVTTVSQPTPAGLIQRQPADQAISPPGSGIMQQVTETPPAASKPLLEKKADLDELARQIYPLIKRMLAVERERMPRR
jgi:hypothetical protein